MNQIPSCGHVQCAGEAFCGFTGQRIIPWPPVAVPSRNVGLWIGLAFGGLGVLALLGVGMWFASGYLRDADRPSVEARKRVSKDTVLRIPKMAASIPITAIYMAPGGFADLGLEATVGRLLTAEDAGRVPPATVLTEGYAEMIIRGARALKESSPEHTEWKVPNPEEFIGQEIEVAGQKAVVVGIAGPNPVTRGVLREGFGEASAFVYFLETTQ